MRDSVERRCFRSRCRGEPSFEAREEAFGRYSVAKGQSLSSRRIWLRHSAPDAGKVELVERFAVGRRLLDLGCARGWYGRTAQDAGFDVTYVDMDCDVDPDLRSRFVLASAEALPFEDGAFDTTLALDVLEHVEDEARALEEVARVTRERLIVSVPSADDGRLHRYNLTFKHHIDKTHQRQYGTGELVEKLARAGFTRLEVKRSGEIPPDLIAEFLPSWLGRPVAKALRKLWHARLLTSGLHADIVVVADRQDENPQPERFAGEAAKPLSLNPVAGRRKWLLVTPHFWPEIGGVQDYLLRCCRALGLSERGTVLALNPPSGPETPVGAPAGLTVVRIPQIRRLRWIGALVRGLPLAIRHRPLLLAGMSDSSGLLVAILAWVTRRPFAVFAYGSELSRPSWIRARVLCRARCVVAISGFTAGVVAERAAGIGAAGTVRIRLIPPVVDDFAEGVPDDRAASPEHEGNTLLTVGRLTARKNHAAVIEAVHRLHPSHPLLRYVIVGDGPERARLEDLSRRLDLGDVVRFTGAVSSEKLRDCYRRADLFVMPTHPGSGDVEGFGIVYLEAAAAGKPVIATRTGGVPDAVEDGVTGVLLDEPTPARLAEVIAQLLDDPWRRRELGMRARERTCREFSPAQLSQRLRALEAEMVGRSA